MQIKRRVNIMEGVPVIWVMTTMGGAEPSELEEYFKEIGFKVKFEEEFEDNEKHKNIIFSVLDNISKFCLFRLQTNDMKWVDDWNENNPGLLPDNIIEKYA